MSDIHRPGPKLPGFVTRYGETVMVPVALTIIYIFFVHTAEARGTALIVAGVFLVGVLALWFGFRRLKLHAQASRMAGVGDPDGLLALVARELPRSLTEAGRRSLRLHAAIAYNLKGDLDAARRELDASGFLTARGRRGRGWVALAAATDVTTRTEAGDVDGARKSLALLAPFTTLAPFGGVELMGRECEARIKLAAGDAEGARAMLAPMVKDIRLGDGARAQVHALLSRAHAALGEPEEATAHAARARELAPRCRLLRDRVEA